MVEALVTIVESRERFHRFKEREKKSKTQMGGVRGRQILLQNPEKWEPAV